MPPYLKMSLDYYIRNLDQLQTGNRCGTPRNAVLDKTFSDTQSSSGGSSGVDSVMTYSGIGGEFSFQDDRLIDATITLLFRDGLNYEETTGAFTMMDKEFKFYPQDDEDLSIVAGTVTFPPDPFPPLNQFEKVNILYQADGGVVIVTEPVTLNQAKDWLKVETSDDDAIITSLIKAARLNCEGYVDKSFVERTVTAIVKNELGNIRLPYGPVNNIVSISDSDGVAITDYGITGISDKRLAWPASSYVKIEYTAGYAVCPDDFITAIKVRLTELYQNRGDAPAIDKSMAALILSPYRSIV